jgi:hypothetical protein
MTSGSSMLAITLSLPPQPVQVSVSIPNTRFTRYVRRTSTFACAKSAERKRSGVNHP